MTGVSLIKNKKYYIMNNIAKWINRNIMSLNKYQIIEDKNILIKRLIEESLLKYNIKYYDVIFNDRYDHLGKISDTEKQVRINFQDNVYCTFKIDLNVDINNQLINFIKEAFPDEYIQYNRKISLNMLL